MKEIKDKYIYIELLYKKYFLKKGIKEEELFPSKWYSNNNYNNKIELLLESINTDTLINNLSTYKEKTRCIRKNND